MRVKGWLIVFAVFLRIAGEMRRLFDYFDDQVHYITTGNYPLIYPTGFERC
jgi:hypothetical protein